MASLVISIKYLQKKFQFHKFFQKTENGVIFPNSFYKASITLIQSKKNKTILRKLQMNISHGMHIKLLNKILANLTIYKKIIHNNHVVLAQKDKAGLTFEKQSM